MGEERTDDSIVRANRLAMVEAFADDLAHEIKNPLHSIALHLEILRRRLAHGEVTPEEIERYFGRLTTDVERASGRLEILLRIARPPRTSRRASAAEIVHGLEELFRVEAKRYTLDLVLETADASGVLAVEVHAFRQVLFNMLLLVCERAPERAKLIVRTSREDAAAEVAILLDSRGSTTLPPADDERRLSVEHIAGVLGLELSLGAGRGADWWVAVRAPVEVGTPSGASGV